MDLVCPNCGKNINIQPSTQPQSCPNCLEALVWSEDGKKLLLSKPLQTYLTPGKAATEISTLWERADRAEGAIDLRRRQATVELAAKAIMDRISLGDRNLKVGGALLAVCMFIVLFAFAKIPSMDAGIPLDAFALFILASLISPFGFFFLMWAIVDRVTFSKYIKQIQQERRILQEEEQALRN